MGVTMEMKYRVDLNGPLKMQEAGTLMVEGDNQAHAIILEVMDDESPAVLDGYTAMAYIIRADGCKPLVECTIEGNIIQAVLSESCYAVPGRYHLFIRLTDADGEVRCTLLWLNGWVNNDGGDNLIDDGDVIPSLEELLAQIAKMEDAVARAEAVANLTVEAETLPAGSEATASYNNGVLTLGLPTGEQGPAGEIPFVTPQMYGAKGDGVTDDTDAFENALAANSAVFVPDGNYLITRSLDITHKKSLYGSDGQRATIYFGGSGSVVNIGRLSVLRNLNIRLKNAFVGTVVNTHNYNVKTGQAALQSEVAHISVHFEVASPDATLIGITVDSGADPDNMPKLTGLCYQTYQDIYVNNDSRSYGCGIKIELIEGRAFTEDSKTGFPWVTHIIYNDVYLGSPYTAVKAMVTNMSGAEHFKRINTGHILFNNVSTQFRNADDTRYFLALEHFGGYFTKCIGWDYPALTSAGEKVNIIGEGTTVCFSDCEMSFGSEFLKSCDFTAETEYNVDDHPEYFLTKYFPGSVFRNGYDIIDAKIAEKLTDAHIGNIAEDKINELLFSGYANVMDDPLTQVKVGKRWSNSGSEWVDSVDNTTVIIPILPGGNIIRWAPDTYLLSKSFQGAYFFADDEMTESVYIGTVDELYNADKCYLEINNPSGYKYASIPFRLYNDISVETMTMTINREITGEEGVSYTQYMRENVIAPAIDQEVKNRAETWTFTLADGSTVTKKVVLS